MGLPLPRVVSDVGPGGRLFTNVNAVNKEGLERRKQELENQYYGPIAYANAMSKMAYAQTAFPDAIAKFMMSPAGQAMTREERGNLNKVFQGYVNNIPNNSNAFQQMVQQGNRGNGLLGLLLQGIQGAMQPGQGQNALIPQQTQMAPQSAPAAPSAPMGGTTPPPGGPEGNYKKVGGAMEFQPGGGEEEMPTATGAVGTPSPGVGPATPAGTQAASLNIPGTQGGMTPELGAKVQETQATTAATGQTEAENLMMKETRQNAQNLSEIAPQLEKITDGFEANVNNSYWSGARTGTTHTTGIFAAPSLLGHDLTPEQLADSYAEQGANLVANWLNTGGGHVNDSLREQAKNIKFSRAQDPGARQVIVDQTRAFTDRGSEYGDYVPFITRKNPDITSAELNQLFNKYQRFFPNYDYKNNKPDHQNDDLWRIFASPEALTIYRATGNFKPTEVKKMPDGRIFFKVNGRLFSE